jgi:hypothetical protein
METTLFNLKVSILGETDSVIIPIEAPDAETAIQNWKNDPASRDQLDGICKGQQNEEGRHWDFVVEVI